MARNNLPDRAAREIRDIVLKQDNFVWVTHMKQIKFIFGVTNLGRNIVKDMLHLLQSEGVECFSGNSEPTQEKDPIFLFLKGCEHSVVFGKTDEPQNHNGHVSELCGPVAG